MLLLTGATGFIGQTLVPRLLAQGHDIRILARQPALARKLFPGARVVAADITRKGTLRPRQFTDVEAVIHLAAIIGYEHPADIHQVNYEGTKHILSFCRNVDRFIFSSSIAVYGAATGVIDESTPPRPRGAYGTAKLLAENEIAHSGMENFLLRIAPVYGAGSPWFRKILSRIGTYGIVPRTHGRTHLVHVDDVVQALQRAVSSRRAPHGKQGACIIADARPVRLQKLAEQLARGLGKPPRYLPLWALSLSSAILRLQPLSDVLLKDRAYRIGKARKMLGYRPAKEIGKELPRMVEWYLQTRRQGA